MDIKLDEGRVFGARYHTAEPKIMSWDLSGDWGGIDIWGRMEAWCTETFGESEGTFEPNQRWYVNSARFWFRNQADLTCFLLKWQ